jgi:hypothetical protein
VTVGTRPGGRVDTLQLVSGGARIRGWTIDPNTAAPLRVHYYLNGVAMAGVTADKARPDVGAAHPGWGPNHGFDDVLTGVQAGDEVCAYAINDGPGGNPLLGCRSV